jgi:hypothetical protein
MENLITAKSDDLTWQILKAMDYCKYREKLIGKIRVRISGRD